MDIDGGVAGGPHIVLGQENAHSNDEARSHDRGLDHRTCLDSHNLLPHPGDAPPTSQARVVWSRISVLASWPSSHYISNRPNESRLSHPSIPSVLWREGNASQLAEAATPGPRPVPGKKAGSVPFLRVTANCSGVSWRFHSSSCLITFSVVTIPILFPESEKSTSRTMPGPCRWASANAVPDRKAAEARKKDRRSTGCSED